MTNQETTKTVKALIALRDSEERQVEELVKFDEIIESLISSISTSKQDFSGIDDAIAALG